MCVEVVKCYGVDDFQVFMKQYVKLINWVIVGRLKDMVIGIYFCRGNFWFQWFVEGGYEFVVEMLFKELDVDVYFLEYDDQRLGDFQLLRFLFEGKIVVLGVMSSKKVVLDDKEDIKRRLKEVVGYCLQGLDQFCLSYQCGFSLMVEGNDFIEEEQWVKVRLEVEIVKEVWGEDLFVQIVV